MEKQSIINVLFVQLTKLTGFLARLVIAMVIAMFLFGGIFNLLSRGEEAAIRAAVACQEQSPTAIESCIRTRLKG